jgi:hypothetical protein
MSGIPQDEQIRAKCLTNERRGFMPVENSLYICLGPATGLYSTGQSLHKLKSKKKFTRRYNV